MQGTACPVASRVAACNRACRGPASRQPLVLQSAPAPIAHSRRRLHPRCAAASEADASPAPEQVPAAAAVAAQDTVEVRKPKLMTEAWNEVVQMRKEGTVLETVVKSANKSGLLMSVGKLTGFLPYKLLDPSRIEQRHPDGTRIPTPPNGHQKLVGTPLRVKVTQVIVPENRLVVSEKAVLLDELAAMLRPGDIVEGAVGSITDWGAFIECHAVNGQACPRAEVVLPMREISYSWLNSATEVLHTGQLVRVAVLHREQAPQAKVVVSLKRLEEDPLKETLDNVLPLGKEAGSYEQLSVPTSVPQGVDEILEALDREAGITSITLGRCVEEKRTVSQDLELWITKEVVDDGYHLAVRAGKVVQEVIVSTKMSPQDMRTTVQRVLRSIN